MESYCAVAFSFANNTGETFYCSSSNSALRVSSPQLGPGETGTISGGASTDSNAAFDGVITLCKGAAGAADRYQISWSVLGNGSGSTIAVATPAGYALVPLTLSVGAPLTAGASYALYAGVAQAPGSTTSVMSLTADPMTSAAATPQLFANFTDAMFDPAVRGAGQITALIDAVTTTITDQLSDSGVPPVFYADFTGGQIPVIVEMWAKYWMTGTAGTCPAADATLIDFIKGFIATPTPPDLWLPLMTVHDAGPPAVFNLKGYHKLGFYKSNSENWSGSTVSAFLTLLATGGHMVAVCADSDLADIVSGQAPDFYHDFATSNLTRGDELGSSHYVSPHAINPAGWYFLDIDGETMPTTVTPVSKGAAIAPGLINAFMTSATVTLGHTAVDQGKYNAFFQLEGWQQQGATGGTRHMADYATYNQVMWNISTFGASPYSEKRGTAAFLAPHGWQPGVMQVTQMMPYVGAYAVETTTTDRRTGTVTQEGPSPQPWLNTGLVRVASDAPPLDSRYLIEITVTSG